MLISALYKVFNGIILDRMKTAMDNMLRDHASCRFHERHDPIICILLNLISRSPHRTSPSYLDFLLSIGRDWQLHTSIYDKQYYFNFLITNLPFLSCDIHLRRSMAFLSLRQFDTPGLAPHLNVLYWGPGDFPVSYCLPLWIRPVLFSPCTDLRLIRPVLNSPSYPFYYILLYV